MTDGNVIFHGAANNTLYAVGWAITVVGVVLCLPGLAIAALGGFLEEWAADRQVSDNCHGRN